MCEKVKSELTFPSCEGFIQGIARSKFLSAYLPVLHISNVQEMSKLTIRYLQYMVAKCLVLGHAPLESVELFGYNLVIEIASEAPVQ